MTVALQSAIQPNGVTQGDLVRTLQNLRDAINELQTEHTALLADVTAMRTSFNTLVTKLNADAGVTDTNYAAAAALTAVALTESAITLAKG